MSRPSTSMKELQALRQAQASGGSWARNWRDTEGGFNPDVFKNLDDVTRQKLLDYQIGPPVLKGDKINLKNIFDVGKWKTGGDWGMPLPYGLSGIRNESREGQHGTNRGSVQQAVSEMGLPNIETPEHLTQFLDRTDALTAKHGNFLEDGWDPKDIRLYREAPQQAVATAHPVVDTPVATVDVPEVVEQEPVPKEPIEGVDYMSSDMKNTYDRMQDYNIGFKPEDWIAKTSKSDIDKQQLAQRLADTYKFEIAKNLQPDPQSVVNALTTAIPDKLGVYS